MRPVVSLSSSCIREDENGRRRVFQKLRAPGRVDNHCRGGGNTQRIGRRILLKVSRVNFGRGSADLGAKASETHASKVVAHCLNHRQVIMWEEKRHYLEHQKIRGVFRRPGNYLNRCKSRRRHQMKLLYLILGEEKKKICQWDWKG